jgi:fumarylacetoacetate (FAA) hydrolase
MKLISYLHHHQEGFGFIRGDLVFPLHVLDKRLPEVIDPFLRDWDALLPVARETEKELTGKINWEQYGIAMNRVQLLAPVPRPGSLRDGYAFRQHVETARKNRRLPMIPEYDLFPVFYFSNHRSVRGPGDVPCMPDHFKELDFELEAAIVISKPGRNIRAAEADRYIGGMMIMNDLSARALQREEMKLSLGPVKGKDFATCTGPWLLSMDELAAFETKAAAGHTGKSWDLEMLCSVNGTVLSRGNLSAMQWTFAEIIERASYGADLFPGDLIGSGTVGGGCLLELNGTAVRADAAFIPQWLKAGDEITMTVSGLGTLRNTVVPEI